jgi:hypothetical protein
MEPIDQSKYKTVPLNQNGIETNYLDMDKMATFSLANVFPEIHIERIVMLKAHLLGAMLAVAYKAPLENVQEQIWLNIQLGYEQELKKIQKIEQNQQVHNQTSPSMN